MRKNVHGSALIRASQETFSLKQEDQPTLFVFITDYDAEGEIRFLHHAETSPK